MVKLEGTVTFVRRADESVMARGLVVDGDVPNLDSLLMAALLKPENEGKRFRVTAEILNE